MVVGQAGAQVTFAWSAPASGPAPERYALEGGVFAAEVLASIVTPTPAPTITLTVPTGAFYVRVHALAGGLRSGASNEIRIVVNVAEPPSPPANLLGLVNGSSVALSWSNTCAGGAPTALWLSVSGSLNAAVPLPGASG